MRRADGVACAGTVLPVESLVGDGVSLDFDCPPATDAVEVDVSLMTDLHPAYETLASGPWGQRFVYTADATAHRWSFVEADVTDDLGRSALIQLGAVGAALAVLGAAATLVVRRRSR